MIHKLIATTALLTALIFPSNQHIHQANADPLSLDIGKISLVLPFTTLNVVYLFDVVNERSLMGGESIILHNEYWLELNFTVGGVTDLDANAVPFIGVDFPLPESFFSESLSFGGFFGYDFNANPGQKEQIAGIKANVLLW